MQAKLVDLRTIIRKPLLLTMEFFLGNGMWKKWRRENNKNVCLCVFSDSFWAGRVRMDEGEIW